MRFSDSAPESQDPSQARRRLFLRRALQAAAWAAAGLTLATLMAAATIIFLLNSPGIHRSLLRRAEAEASDSLGVRVQLRDFALHFSTLSVDLDGVIVDGANPYPNPPLLQIDHLEAGVRIVSILRGAWYFDRLRIDRPVLRVFVDSHGVSNIPAPKNAGKNANNTSVFDLGIRHVLLNQGEVDYNGKPYDVAADLHEVAFSASFNSLLRKYSGRFAYTGGHISYGKLRPFEHSLDAQFEATPSTFSIIQSKLILDGVQGDSQGRSQIALSATLRNYSDPEVRGRYDISVNGKQMAEILHDPSVPAGMIRATGSVQYRQLADHSALDSLLLEGDLSSPRLEMKTSAMRANIDQIAGRYSLANGEATLRDLRASLLGGELTAQGDMSNIGGDSRTSLAATLRGVSLADLRQALGSNSPPRAVALSGTLNATAKASWGKTMDDLEALTDATINSQIVSSQPPNTRVSKQNPAPSGNDTAAFSTVPVNSEIHATYTAMNRQLMLDRSYLRTAQTSLTMNGMIGAHSSLACKLQANDLREWETIADFFRTLLPDHPLQPLGLAGTASFQGIVQGSTAAPHLTGQLTAMNFHFNGTAWKLLRTDVDVSPSLFSLNHADLEPASQGRVTFSASTGLVHWSLSDTSPMQLELHASQVNIADFTNLIGQQVPLTGTLNANITLHGTRLNPMGSGEVALTKGIVYEQPVQTAKLTFSGSGNEVHGDVSVQLPAGSLQGKASIHPDLKTYTAELTASGIQLNKLQALSAKNVDASGILAFNAKGQGSFDNPQMEGSLQIPTLLVHGQTFTGINLRMNVANRVAEATLESSAMATTIQAKAKVNLTGDYPVDATLDTQQIPLQALLAVYAPQAEAVSGQTEIHATLHGPLKDTKQLEGHVAIPILQIAYGNTVQLAAAAPINIDYKNGVIALQRTSIRGTDTDLQLEGSAPVTGNGPISLVLLGTVNLQLAQLFDADVRSSGQLRFNINAHGAAAESSFGGQIDIVDANFTTTDLPAGLQHGNGVLTLTRNRINISSFNGVIGGGTITAQGGVAYSPGIQFDLGLAAQGIRILYPRGMRESVDAQLKLAGSTEKAVLGGAVNLSDLSFTQAFDLSSFISQFSGGVAAPPSRGFAENLQLNIALNSTNNVNLVSRTLSVGGSANLQLRGTAANPVVLGRVNLSDGDIILNGNRYVLNGGTIQFVNPSETQPVVNLTLNTTIQQYSINLSFRGPVNQLRTEYSSNPALPSADIINLLAFGTTTEASAASATPANQAAESLVASQVSSQVTSRISKIAGISQLSINPVLAGSSSQGPPGANITIQQRVTGNLFITFTTNVASTQSQTIQGQYQLSPRIALSATRDPNGGVAFDTVIKKSW